MIRLNLQFFGGRGAGSSSGRMKGGAGISDADILSTTSLVSERESNQALVDETLAVFKDVYDEYGAQVTDIQIATLKPGVPALAYYDGNGNIAFNKVYFDSAKMESAYDTCVKSGFHPSKGNKTAMQAVAAHELGHKLTADVSVKLGTGTLGLDSAATKIVTEARGKTRHRGVVQMASKISKYATQSNAEAVAEAFADVYCNGKKARKESKAIVDVMNKYIK